MTKGLAVIDKKYNCFFNLHNIESWTANVIINEEVFIFISYVARRNHKMLKESFLIFSSFDSRKFILEWAQVRF